MLESKSGKTLDLKLHYTLLHQNLSTSSLQKSTREGQANAIILYIYILYNIYNIMLQAKICEVL